MFDQVLEGHEMAPTRNIEVIVQQFDRDSATWVALEEADDKQSLKPEANSVARLTTVLESRPGQFRFVIRVPKNSTWWASANGLTVNLTFDQGWPVQEYPFAIMRPDALPVMKTAGTPNVGVFKVADDDTKLEYVLDSIALPKNMTEPEDMWCRRQFSFKELQPEGLHLNTNSRRPFVSATELAMLKVVVQLRRLHGFSKRYISLSAKPDDLKRKKSRSFAAQSGITLQTTLTRRQKAEPVPRLSEILSQTIAPHESRTFVFLYREPDYYDKIEDVEVIDRTQVKPVAPISHPSPMQLSSSVFDLDSTSDIENQTPAPRKSSYRSSARTYTQRRSSTANAPAASMSASPDDASFLPLPLLPENDSGSLVGDQESLVRQEEGLELGQVASSDSNTAFEANPHTEHSTTNTATVKTKLQRAVLRQHKIEAEIEAANSQHLRRRENIALEKSDALNEIIGIDAKLDELSHQTQRLQLVRLNWVQYQDELEKEDAAVVQDYEMHSSKLRVEEETCTQKMNKALEDVAECQIERLEGIKSLSGITKRTRKRRRSQVSPESPTIRKRYGHEQTVLEDGVAGPPG